MALRNTNQEFGALAKALHWLVAIGIFALIFLGLEQADMERGDARSQIRFVHASIALAVFVLMTIRVVWRFMNDVPGHPADRGKHTRRSPPAGFIQGQQPGYQPGRDTQRH